MDQWLIDNLACPRDHKSLEYDNNVLRCSEGHKYPVVDGIPVMLLDEVEQTLWVATASIEKARGERGSTDKDEIPFADTLGIDPEEREQLSKLPKSDVDPVVQMSIAKTCGNLYAPLIGNLKSYPIPELRLPDAKGELFLDIGCNWGRWSVAAARKGYDVVGIDPSLGAVMAARRVCAQLGLSARFVVADGRFLPFASAIYDTVFSYSVLQHISKEDVRLALNEIARVLKPLGTSLIQLPNMYGIRCLYNNARRGFHEGRDFDVRYWTLTEMKKTFTSIIGKTSFSVDGYFGLGIQKSDVDILPPRYKLVVRCSERLRRMSLHAKWMTHFADSVYVRSNRNVAGPDKY
jgi:SAM-dependent methyltransferase/uncharacterized protein YbaR (Trm112 family)